MCPSRNEKNDIQNTIICNTHLVLLFVILRGMIHFQRRQLCPNYFCSLRKRVYSKKKEKNPFQKGLVVEKPNRKAKVASLVENGGGKKNYQVNPIPLNLMLKIETLTEQKALSTVCFSDKKEELRKAEDAKKRKELRSLKAQMEKDLQVFIHLAAYRTWNRGVVKEYLMIITGLIFSNPP